jgi:prolyl 4-hydroxylase
MRFYSLLLLLLPAFAEKNSFDQDTYGFDVSWAIRTPHLSSEMGDKQGLYDDFMHKCRAAAGEEKAPYACDAGEEYRLKMNTYQPMSMRNYTKMGFKKIRAPEETFKILKDFWDTNRNKNQTEWKSLNTYHNLWDSPSAIVDIQQPSFGGGPHVTTQVWESARQTLEEWTGMHLSPCSIWGIRIYKNNSILTTHVDRNPLVTSAIINVDQDVDEPWPLEVWGHDGKPYNVTMEPGDMVLYESHSVLHGKTLSSQAFAQSSVL